MDIQSFFRLLQKEGGAVWLEQDTIRLSTPPALQNDETIQFIREHKEQLISLLQSNGVLSKDIFRNTPVLKEKTIAPKQSFQLVTPYHAKRNGRLPYLVFIHPGHGGCEVYKPLAGLLEEEFNCIGIDNYNLYHTEKIVSLNELASMCLSALTAKKWLKEPVNLLGWSLGGHIALEMAAILESAGYRYINIFLLDTFLPGPPEKYKQNKMLELEALEIGEMAAAAKDDKERMAATLEAEYLLASIPVSRYLKYSQLFSFRAARMHASISDEKTSGKLPENHVNKAAATVHTTLLDCDHFDILETNCEQIAGYILSLV